MGLLRGAGGTKHGEMGAHHDVSLGRCGQCCVWAGHRTCHLLHRSNLVQWT